MHSACWKGRPVNFSTRACHLGSRLCVGGRTEYIVTLVGHDRVGNSTSLEEEEERSPAKKTLKSMEETVFPGMLMLWAVGDNENRRTYGVSVYVYVLSESTICLVLTTKTTIAVKEMKNMGSLIRLRWHSLFWVLHSGRWISQLLFSRKWPVPVCLSQLTDLPPDTLPNGGGGHQGIWSISRKRKLLRNRMQKRSKEAGNQRRLLKGRPLQSTPSLRRWRCLRGLYAFEGFGFNCQWIIVDSLCMEESWWERYIWLFNM